MGAVYENGKFTGNKLTVEDIAINNVYFTSFYESSTIATSLTANTVKNCCCICQMPPQYLYSGGAYGDNDFDDIKFTSTSKMSLSLYCRENTSNGIYTPRCLFSESDIAYSDFPITKSYSEYTLKVFLPVQGTRSTGCVYGNNCAPTSSSNSYMYYLASNYVNASYGYILFRIQLTVKDESSNLLALMRFGSANYLNVFGGFGFYSI